MIIGKYLWNFLWWFYVTSRIGWADMGTFLLQTHVPVSFKPKMELRKPFVSCRDSVGSGKQDFLVAFHLESVKSLSSTSCVTWALKVSEICSFVSTYSVSSPFLPDTDTLELMTKPRCSLPDIIGGEDRLKRRRRKRYALTGLKWHKTDLTWRCVSCHVLKSNWNHILSLFAIRHYVNMFLKKVLPTACNWTEVTFSLVL